MAQDYDSWDTLDITLWQNEMAWECFISTFFTSGQNLPNRVDSCKTKLIKVNLLCKTSLTVHEHFVPTKFPDCSDSSKFWLQQFTWKCKALSVAVSVWGQWIGKLENLVFKTFMAHQAQTYLTLKWNFLQKCKTRECVVLSLTFNTFLWTTSIHSFCFWT